MIRANFHITEKQSEKLRELSEQTGMKQAEHVRRALDAYFKSLERGKNNE